MPPVVHITDRTRTAGLLESLQTLRRRVKTLAVAYGAGLFVAAAVGLLLATVLVDYLLNLPAAPRLVLMLAALGTLGWACWRWVVTPSRMRLTLGDLAGHLENAFPQFDDRLRSTVGFLNDPTIPGSDPMKSRTVADADRLAAQVKFADAVAVKPVWWSAAGAMGAVALLVALSLLINSTYLQIAASRLLHPFSGRAWPKSVQIQVVESPPVRVTDGQRLNVQMRLAKGSAKKATIFYRYDDGPWQQELMAVGADGVYASSIDAKLDAGKAAGKLQIKMQAGDDEALLTPVVVVPRLEIDAVVARVTPPPYAKGAVSTVNLSERPATAARGSAVELRINFNKPLDRKQAVVVGASKPDQKLPEFAWNRDEPRVATAKFEAGSTFGFTVKARDEDGFENGGAQEYQIAVREDSTPGVQIEEPRRSEERTPVASFTLRAAAEDDYGVAAAQLVVRRVSESTSSAATQPAGAKPWVIDLVKDEKPASPDVVWTIADGTTAERKHYKLDYQWNLSSLEGLKPGDVIEYFVQVKDNFELKGQTHDWAPSGKLRITIISPADWERLAQDQVERLGLELKEIQKGQGRNQSETSQLAKEARERGRFADAERATADRLSGQQATTASTTMQLAGKLDQLRQRMTENKSPDGGLKRAVAEVSSRLRQTAEGEMKEAGRQLGQATQSQRQSGEASPDQQAKQSQTGQQQANPTGSNAQAARQAEADAQQKSPNGSQRAGEQQTASGKSKNQNAQNSKNGQNPQQSGQQNAGQQPQAQQGSQSAGAQAQQTPQQQNGQQGQSQQAAGQQASPQQKQAAQQSAEALDQSAQQQAAAEQKLGEALSKLGDFSGITDFKNQVEGLKAEQEKLGKEAAETALKNLGKRPEEMNEADRKKMEELAKRQDALKERTEQTLNNMNQKADKSAQSNASQSQAMKQAAQSGQQVPGQQQKNAQAMRQNQQSQAQDAQKRVELGLELVLQKLRDAERRELEELAKKLAEMQELVGELVRRQAGHNLDNMAVRDAGLIAKLTEAERADLFGKAQRDAANPPAAPTTGELTASQKTTERNARDVAKKAEALTDSAPGARLTSAAGQMERAIVHLIANKLSDAYDPPQIEALRNLEEALALIDEAKAQADKQIQQQDQETVRQLYVKLLQDQKKLNGETKEMHAKGENLARDQMVRLGQLPGVQGALSDRAEELGKQLEKLQSIVYAWANRDIVKTMGQVKESLGKPDVGPVTQVEQTRIEKQLEAMIEGLKQTAEEKRFEDRNQNGQAQGGQQGGQQQPKMPGEAELRLLKSLQEALNGSTKIVNDEVVKAGDKDDAAKQKLLSLGGRQGELRNVFDELLKKATEGKVKLAEEPDNRDQLPEEAKEEDIENQELDKALAGGDVGGDQVEQGVKVTGDRMARSRQRLALNNDPGKVTQKIQERIIFDMDNLIKLSKAQAQRSKSQGQQKGQMARQQQPGQQQAGQQQAGERRDEAARNSAGREVPHNMSDREADLSGEFKETRESWGGLTQRDRQAVMEGANDQPIDKYRNLVKDYYRSISEKATQR